jgi:hypothetical protein
MTTKTLNMVAAGVSVAILCGWGIYWGVQVGDVLELLEMAKME